MDSREIIKALERDAWTLARVTGSHYHFYDPEKLGIASETRHPDRDSALDRTAGRSEAEIVSPTGMDYIAIIHKDADTDVGVSFPDFPGCITAGRTLTEAKEMAREALSGHIARMREAGEPLPAPAFDQVMNDPQFRDGAAFFVSLELPANRAAVAAG